MSMAPLARRAKLWEILQSQDAEGQQVLAPLIGRDAGVHVMGELGPAWGSLGVMATVEEAFGLLAAVGALDDRDLGSAFLLLEDDGPVPLLVALSERLRTGAAGLDAKRRSFATGLAERLMVDVTAHVAGASRRVPAERAAERLGVSKTAARRAFGVRVPAAELPPDDKERGQLETLRARLAGGFAGACGRDLLAAVEGRLAKQAPDVT